MRSCRLFAILILIFGAAAIGHAQSIKRIAFRKWDVTKKNVKGVFVPNYDLITSRPLSAELRKTAVEAQLATLKRINGEFKDIFDAAMFRSMPRPLYVVTDTSFSLPSGPPNFIRAQSEKELEALAARTKTDIYRVALRVVGTAKIGARRGVVIQYTFGAVDWEQAQWNALTAAEKSKLKKPKFRLWVFGGGYRFCAIRVGSTLILYEAPMAVA